MLYIISNGAYDLLILYNMSHTYFSSNKIYYPIASFFAMRVPVFYLECILMKFRHKFLVKRSCWVYYRLNNILTYFCHGTLIINYQKCSNRLKLNDNEVIRIIYVIFNFLLCHLIYYWGNIDVCILPWWNLMRTILKCISA